MSRTTGVVVVLGLLALAIALAWRGINRADSRPPQQTDDQADVWGDSDWDDEDDTQPGALDDTYRDLEAMYHAPAAERRQP